MRLLKNSIKTPDGTILTSKYTHDFVMYKDANGQDYGVDGGTEYARRIGNTNECEDLSIWIDEEKFEEEFEVIRENVQWGTRGKDGDKPLKFISVKEMTNDHLENMVTYKGPVNAFIRRTMEYELVYRNKLGIIVFEADTWTTT